ncbi:MAG TPA: UvrB/UvrC motif-containing protein, partial [Sedimentisphaerales bacterium]|nr:UvrB/UvrC motif-containing protein [Sedimentisphaerales bacterium]
DEVVLYIGKAGDLRSRVSSYFQPSAALAASRGPKIVEMIAKVVDVDYLEAASEVDAMLQEARLIKDIHPPYNTQLTDDKTFPYLEITTGDEFPGVYVTREPRAEGSKLYGPFTAAKDVRGILNALQKIFRFRTCCLDIRSNDEKRRFFRPCILWNIRQCTAPCADRITKSDYRKLLKDLMRFLDSKRTKFEKELEKEMTEAASALDFERAVILRDRLRLIRRLDERGVVETHVQPEVFAQDPTDALVRLQEIIGAKKPVRIVEGIDIASIGGEEAVGSLVKFIDGRPFKAGYRRFKIKTVQDPDDYAMMREVVHRRYRHAAEGEELWPDLILIDGGLGHLHAAEEALRQMDAPPTKIAGIAKREEEIFLPGQSQPLRLPARDPARRLLQYVRDEAHRFAQHYHHILRRKKVVGE